jgi:hypothetical protein
LYSPDTNKDGLYLGLLTDEERMTRYIRNLTNSLVQKRKIKTGQNRKYAK